VIHDLQERWLATSTVYRISCPYYIACNITPATPPDFMLLTIPDTGGT
jgi:hypothetical protein